MSDDLYKWRRWDARPWRSKKEQTKIDQGWEEPKPEVGRRCILRGHLVKTKNGEFWKITHWRLAKLPKEKRFEK